MSVNEVEAIFQQVKELSELDRVVLLKALGDEYAPSCAECGVGDAAVCSLCYDSAFNDGVTEASFAAENAARRTPVKPLKAVK